MFCPPQSIRVASTSRFLLLATSNPCHGLDCNFQNPWFWIDRNPWFWCHRSRSRRSAEYFLQINCWKSHSLKPKNINGFYLVWDHNEWWVVWFRSSTWEQKRPASQSISLHAQKWFYAEMEHNIILYLLKPRFLWHLPALGKSPNHGHHSILRQYRMNWHRFQRRQTAGQCADAEGSCGYCTLGAHV